MVYIKDTSPTENDEGTSDDTQYTLSLGLTRASEKTITIPFSYDNAPDEDESPAGEDTDFEMDTDPGIIIEVGVTTAEINFTVLGDATDEYDQTIYFEIEADGGDNTNVNTADADDNYPEASYPFKWEYTITNDDGPPNISITSEAGAGEAETQDVTLTIDEASEKPIVINFEVTDGTAIRFTGPSTNYDPTADETEPDNFPKADFTFETTTKSFTAGETVAAFTVTGLDDDIYEGAESFTITITAADDATTADINEADNVTIGTGTATVTLTSDDPIPLVGFIENMILISEAESTWPDDDYYDVASEKFVLQVKQDRESGYDTQITYAIGDNSTATNPDDYGLFGDNTVTIAANAAEYDADNGYWF